MKSGFLLFGSGEIRYNSGLTGYGVECDAKRHTK